MKASTIFSDLARFKKPSFKNFVIMLCTNRSYKCVFWFRMSKLPPPLGVFSLLFYRHYSTIYGIDVPSNTVIGGGLKIAHCQNIVITNKAVIGDNCTIFQGVTIGCNIIGNLQGPTIGNNVTICAGAKIIGNISIGNNVIIGANAVVVKNIPDNCIAVGVPAKILRGI